MSLKSWSVRKATARSVRDRSSGHSAAASSPQVEAAIAALQETLAEPGFYAQDGDAVRETLDSLAATETELEERVERWGALETLAASFGSR